MMIKHLVTPAHVLTLVDQSDSLEKAFTILHERGFLSIPVMNGRAFQGLISKQGIYDRFLEAGMVNWGEFIQQPISVAIEESFAMVSNTTSIEDAANIFLNNNIRFLPVRDGATTIFAGILTQKAIFNVVTQVYGLLDPKIILWMDDIKGNTAKVTDIISKNGGNLKNLAIYDPEIMGLLELSIRLTTEQVGDMERIIEKLKDQGFKIQSVTK